MHLALHAFFEVRPACRNHRTGCNPGIAPASNPHAGGYLPIIEYVSETLSTGTRGEHETRENTHGVAHEHRPSDCQKRFLRCSRHKINRHLPWRIRRDAHGGGGRPSTEGIERCDCVAILNPERRQ